MSEYCVVLVTAEHLNRAESIADVLVKEKLAACVNIVDYNVPRKLDHKMENQRYNLMKPKGGSEWHEADNLVMSSRPR